MTYQRVECVGRAGAIGVGVPEAWASYGSQGAAAIQHTDADISATFRFFVFYERR